jgi:hypothetical protein
MANKKVKIELTAINKTKAAFSSVTGGLKSIGGAAAGAAKGIAGVGIAAVAAAGAIALIVDKSFQAVDAIGKTATQTGIATDTLQAFYLAARESGSSIEGANTSLIKFAKNIGDAQKGLKTQADLFNDMGISLEKADGSMKSFDQLLEETADGITNLGDQTARASALSSLFGKQGIILTGALKDLSVNGIKNFIGRAKELGVVLSDDVIKRTEQFNDAVGVIKLQLSSFVHNITTSLLPVFEKMQTVIAEKIKQIIKSAGGMDQLGLNIANGIIEASASMVESFGFIVSGVTDMANKIGFNFAGIGISMEGLRNQALKVRASLNPFQDLTKEIAESDEKMMGYARTITNTRNNVSDFHKTTSITAAKIRGMKLDVSDLSGGIKKLGEDIKGTGTDVVNLLSPTEKFIASLKDVNLSIENAAVSSMKKFEDTIMNGLKNGKFAFQDFASFVVEQLLRIALQQMIIAPMAQSLFGVIPKFDGGGYTGMGSRAGGVDGKGGFPAILHPNETVVDHTKGQSTGGGANITFNIQANDAAGFDQLLNSRKQMITAMINNAMNNRGKMGVV